MNVRCWAAAAVITLGSAVATANTIDAETLGVAQCAMLFASAMNTSAIQNNPGGVKFWALQYGRAYVTYGALSIQRRRVSADTVNREMAEHAAKWSREILRRPDIAGALSSCQISTGQIFVKLENSGFRLDPRSRETLSDVAAAMATLVRKDLGF